MEADSLSEAKLWEEVVQEVGLLLAPALSSHISGWLKEWKEVFSRHPGILHLVLETFKGYNQRRLGRAASLVGAHRAREGLEVAALGDFLLAQCGQGELQWCVDSLYLPGLVRGVLASPHLAREHLGLLVELGDTQLLVETGLLGQETAGQVLHHLVTVYRGESCPLAWEEVARALLATLGPSQALARLREVAPRLHPKVFTRG